MRRRTRHWRLLFRLNLSHSHRDFYGDPHFAHSSMYPPIDMRKPGDDPRLFTRRRHRIMRGEPGGQGSRIVNLRGILLTRPIHVTRSVYPHAVRPSSSLHRRPRGDAGAEESRMSKWFLCFQPVASGMLRRRTV